MTTLRWPVRQPPRPRLPVSRVVGPLPAPAGTVDATATPAVVATVAALPAPDGPDELDGHTRCDRDGGGAAGRDGQAGRGGHTGRGRHHHRAAGADCHSWNERRPDPRRDRHRVDTASTGGADRGNRRRCLSGHHVVAACPAGADGHPHQPDNCRDRCGAACADGHDRRVGRNPAAIATVTAVGGPSLSTGAAVSAAVVATVTAVGAPGRVGWVSSLSGHRGDRLWLRLPLRCPQGATPRSHPRLSQRWLRCPPRACRPARF